MYQKFNLIVLALLYLIAQNFTSKLPTHFREVATWNVPPTGDARFAIVPDRTATGSVIASPISTSVSSSGLQLRLPDQFADQKFLRFKAQLVFSAASGDFHLELRDADGRQLCQVRLGNDGKVWVCERVNETEKRELVGVISIKPVPMNLVVDLNMPTAEMAISVDGSACKPMYVRALDVKAMARTQSTLQTVGLEFTPTEVGQTIPGRLLHLSLEEAGNG